MPRTNGCRTKARNSLSMRRASFIGTSNPNTDRTLNKGGYWNARIEEGGGDSPSEGSPLYPNGGIPLAIPLVCVHASRISSFFWPPFESVSTNEEPAGYHRRVQRMWSQAGEAADRMGPDRLCCNPHEEGSTCAERGLVAATTPTRIIAGRLHTQNGISSRIPRAGKTAVTSPP